MPACLEARVEENEDARRHSVEPVDRKIGAMGVALLGRRMLKGISPLLSPDLLHTLCRMGHGDTIVLADAHFPGESFNDHVIRADGHEIAPLLGAILPLMVLDPYVDEPVEMMAAVPGDVLDPAVAADYLAAMRPHAGAEPKIKLVERFAFYEEARKAFAVVMTGELRKYGNIILRKGVTPA